MTGNRTVSKRLRDWMLKSVPGMLTCKELDGYIVDYVDDQLPAKERRKFTLHMLLCAGCRRYLKAYRRTMKLCAESVFDAEHPERDEIPEALVGAIVSAGRSKPEHEK